MTDFSDDSTVVQYAVQEQFKGKSLATAAKNTSQRLGGNTNMFIGGGAGVVEIDPKKLEKALINNMIEYTVKNMQRYKVGTEGRAIGATIQHFRLGKKDAVAFHKALIDITGPLAGDDETPEQIVESINRWR